MIAMGKFLSSFFSWAGWAIEDKDWRYGSGKKMGEAVENGAQGSILAGMDIASGKNLVALMKPDAATHNAHLAYLGYEKQ